MTDNEVLKILKNIDKLLSTMDREHVERLLCVLLDIKNKGKDSVSSYVPSLRKTVKQMLNGYENTPQPTKCFTHKQIKEMYVVLGDYDCFPICQLCGHPIKIDSETVKHTKQSQPMVFTWDHIKPKSLGGATNLANLQPSHKICNNQKGSTPPESMDLHEHYDITVTIKMKVGSIEQFDTKKKNNKKKPYNLRKQENWCHKHRSCPCCCR